MRAKQSIDNEHQSEQDSFDFGPNDVERHDSIKSDDVEELIRNTNKEIDNGMC